MGKRRQFKGSGDIAIEGHNAKDWSGHVSKILTPMRNTDIRRLEETGDWSELLEKARVQTRNFRYEFYKLS